MARVLVVDDDPAIRRLVSLVLTAEGHEVDVAADGVAAVDAVRDSLPDLLILDLAMPEADGWLVLETLHRLGLRARTRVLIMSGALDDEAVARARASAVRHVLPKPFALEELLRLVDDALEQDAAALYERRERSDALVRLMERVGSALD